MEPDREDGSDDEGAISLNAIKNKYQAKSKIENNSRDIYFIQINNNYSCILFSWN